VINRRLAPVLVVAFGGAWLLGCTGPAAPPSGGVEDPAAPATESAAAAQPGAPTQPGPPSDSPITSGTTSEVAAPKTVEEVFVEGADRLAPAATVAQAVDSGIDVLFLDARATLDFEAGHIPGAVNVPYFETEKHLDKLPKDRWIVAYCECPTAEANQVADTLEKNGYTMVRVIEEGLQGWRDLGRETVGGPETG